MKIGLDFARLLFRAPPPPPATAHVASISRVFADGSTEEWSWLSASQAYAYVLAMLRDDANGRGGPVKAVRLRLYNGGLVTIRPKPRRFTNRPNYVCSPGVILPDTRP